MIPATVGELNVLIRDDTRFIDNASRVGSGVLPVPDVLAGQL